MEYLGDAFKSNQRLGGGVHSLGSFDDHLVLHVSQYFPILLISLFVAQRNHRIDLGRSPGWQQAGRQPNYYDYSYDCRERQRIGGRDTPNLASDQPRQTETREQANDNTRGDQL